MVGVSRGGKRYYLTRTERTAVVADSTTNQEFQSVDDDVRPMS